MMVRMMSNVTDNHGQGPDLRTDPPLVADERTMLEAWLDYHRATLERKCAGLTAQQLRERSVPPSSMSLLGLVRHMADVERGWFSRTLLRKDLTEVPPLFYSEADPDGDFDNVDAAEPEEAFAAWRGEVAAARKAVAGLSLDHLGRRRDGEYSLRWIMVHMIEEYARHNGHADLLRERIDGATGE
jgi:uncharacterized damage-inducible protein DinB